ncbi:hypothetical protein C0Q70_14514 [Pomacea canaliculata]|uniref:EGF-like domain-containing protein n=1 Tax=Pomacea canaliculata TaxID=400727 RepID=A0A2T7NS96_POMCA|nr:hypothetical protein C0Q70_14514 [Pomacea canaliculata]
MVEEIKDHQAPPQRQSAPGDIKQEKDKDNAGDTPSDCLLLSSCGWKKSKDNLPKKRGVDAFIARSDAVALGGTCTATTDCTTTNANSECRSSVCKCVTGYAQSGTTCKIKAGDTCAANADCVSQSTCTSDKCTCGTGYTAGSTGLCRTTRSVFLKIMFALYTQQNLGAPIKAGAACTSGSTNCVSQSTCSTSSSTTTCTCNSGYTALTTGLCNGVAPQSVSSWLLTGSIITLLVTLCLP